MFPTPPSSKMLASLHLSLSSVLLLASAAITPIQAIAPTAPGPGDVFRAGSNCTISWSTDSEAQWGNFSIDLMTGSNTNMSIVMPVIQGLVGKDPDITPYNWTCPEVDPYSSIYFYQFTADTGDNVLKQWTTRFTLASSTGDSEPPAKSTQPGGDQIPWGIGHLVGGTKDLGNTSSTNSSTNSTEHDEGGDEGSKQGASSSAVPRHQHHTQTLSTSSTASPTSEAHAQTPTTFASTSVSNVASPRDAHLVFTLCFLSLLACTYILQ